MLSDIRKYNLPKRYLQSFQYTAIYINKCGVNSRFKLNSMNCRRFFKSCIYKAIGFSVNETSCKARLKTTAISGKKFNRVRKFWGQTKSREIDRMKNWALLRILINCGLPLFHFKYLRLFETSTSTSVKNRCFEINGFAELERATIVSQINRC